MSSVDDDLTPRPALDGDTDVDVCVVGAGYTGLWTAYYLARARPTLRIAVVEAEIAGYGASGRNGGWCSALFPQSVSALARRHGRAAAVALYRAMQATVDEVGAVTAAEGIDCDFAKGGTITMARTPVQLERARLDIQEAREYGFTEDDLRLLDAEEAARRCGAAGVLGATYTPHCAAIHPAKLVRGLARAVERRGVTIYERTRVQEIRPRTTVRQGDPTGTHPNGTVVTDRGTVRAATVVRATEGYTPTLPSMRRVVAPVYSLMLSTAPLPASFWAEVGLARRETFTDHRHLIIYGQRTADDRLAFGGRGAPYHFRSAVRPEFDRDAAVHAALRETLAELFPSLPDDLEITHHWGGPLGVPRDWHPSVGLDQRTGVGWAGGYVGDGVGTANLAGRTLADLIAGADSELVRLPWVGHRSPRWEPEPLRWLGVNAGLRVMTAADAEEARTGRPSRRAALFSRLLGG
ncbi:FAD-dependent oxidoreductase [Luedemannella helvata]